MSTNATKYDGILRARAPQSLVSRLENIASTLRRKPAECLREAVADYVRKQGRRKQAS